jgi:KUP system potassium uptake protein
MSPISFFEGALTYNPQAMLVVLFLSQRFGTAKLAFLFAPGISFASVTVSVLDHIFHVVALIWFLIIAISGIYNTTTHPGIFRAFDPSRAVMRTSLQSSILSLYPC